MEAEDAVKELTVQEELKAAVKEIGFGAGWAHNCVLWILASIHCGSTDRQKVREFMSYKNWFDTCADKLKEHGYLKRGKLCLPAELTSDDHQLATVVLVLVGMEIDGIVVRVPNDEA